MSDRALVDTNVLAYQFDSRDPSKQAVAAALLARRDLIFCVSTQILSEFYVTATRKIGVPAAGAAAALRQYRRLEVVVVDTDLVIDAVDLAIKNQISLWDAQIVCAATRGGCGLIYTEDLHNGQFFGDVEVVNPFAE